VLETGPKVNFFDAFTPKNLKVIEIDSKNDYMLEFYGQGMYNNSFKV